MVNEPQQETCSKMRSVSNVFLMKAGLPVKMIDTTKRLVSLYGKWTSQEDRKLMRQLGFKRIASKVAKNAKNIWLAGDNDECYIFDGMIVIEQLHDRIAEDY